MLLTRLTRGPEKPEKTGKAPSTAAVPGFPAFLGPPPSGFRDVRPAHGVDESAAPSDADRELAARRRDLEQEFDDKLRDLKAQERRRAQGLEQDRIDWEAGRKEKDRQLADRAEKMRRQEENHKRDLEALKAARRELEAAQTLRKEHDAMKAQAKAAQATGTGLAAQLTSTKALAGWFAFVGIVGSAAILYAIVVDAPRVAGGLVAAMLAVTLGMNAWRMRLRR